MVFLDRTADRNWNGNGRLLRWRTMLAVVLAATTVAVRQMSGQDLFPAGMQICLGLLGLGLLIPLQTLRTERQDRGLMMHQLALDMVCITLLVHFSGGTTSICALFYSVPILLAGYYVNSRSALVLGMVAALLTAGGLVAYTTGMLPDMNWAFSADNVDRLVLTAVLHMALFILIARLSGLQADRTDSDYRLRNQATAQMHKAKHEVRNILDNINSGLLIIDNRSIITRTNPAAEEILGITDEVVGQPIQTALGCGMEEFIACIQEVLDSGRPVSRRDTEVQLPDRTVPLGLSVSCNRDRENNFTGAIAIFRDLTEVNHMRQRMREQDRLAGVGELAASIAHEIRNPLGSIRGSVEILASELELSGHQDKLLQLILKESARVNTIINDFLSFARLRPACRQQVKGSDFLGEALLQIRQHLTVHSAEVKLQFRLEPEDLTLFIDPEQMTQVFLNLAINACEAMEYRGELQIVIGESRDGRYHELQVNDSGPGIDPAVADELYKPFVTSKKNGTGLGLPMVARIAHAHGGFVAVQKSPCGGAGFALLLERYEQPESALTNTRTTTLTTRDAAQAADPVPSTY
ncbi:MAG: histidine kinase dimerization/phospho-acceptor domain-containing protein [bacterium]